MKKNILTIIAIISIVYSGMAQSKSTANNLKLGLKLGANYSNVFDSKDNEFHADSKFGLALGGFVSIPFSEYFGFQPELLFSQK